MGSDQPIVAGSIIEQVLERYPALRSVFTQRGMYCPICDLARFDTIADAAREYELPIEELVALLNAAVAAPHGAIGPSVG